MKKTFKKLACMAMVASLGVGAIMAQDTQTTNTDSKKVEYSIYLGASTPLGSFGQAPSPGFPVEFFHTKLSWNDDITYGDADCVGANIGVKAKYNIPGVKGLGIMATADMFLNTTFGFKIKEDNSSDDVINNEFYSAHINIPVMLGANYDYAINDKVSIWGEAAVGANLRIITKEGTTMRVEYLDNIELTFMNKYDNCFTLGFQAGAGVKLKDKYSIGVHYYNLGTKTITGVMTDITPGVETLDMRSRPFERPELETSMLLIRFGYHF
jgi:hypothetical protein